MLATFGQYLGGKVVTAILVVAGGATLIYFYNNPDDLAVIWKTIKYALIWLGFVVVLPWATFFVTPWVVSKESNALAAVMLLGYLLLDAALALFLMGGIWGHGTLAWSVVLLGFLLAAVYNFKACEFQAEQASNAL
ncbi:MAG: hypothetical protein ACPGXK_03350 [Phycisphaerae bacterium]